MLQIKPLLHICIIFVKTPKLSWMKTWMTILPVFGGSTSKPHSCQVLKPLKHFHRTRFQLILSVDSHNVTKNLTGHRMHVEGPQVYQMNRQTNMTYDVGGRRHQYWAHTRLYSEIRYFQIWVFWVIFMHHITFCVIDIHKITCLKPFLPLYDHFEIWRFLSLNWQY